MIGFLKRVRRSDRMLLDKVKQEHCVNCGASPVDPAHIQSRGAGGDDSFENVLPLCRPCHHHQHYVGLCRFARLNKPVLEALWLRGWDVVNQDGRWRLVRMNEVACD